MKKILLVLTMLAFISTLSFSAASGGIRGTVKSSEGEALPGILVTITSPAIILKQMTTLTNENGVYRFATLLPGKYQVKFELEGMQTSIRKGITVMVGKTMTVDMAMSLKTINEKIVVEAKAPTIDRQKTTGVASMDLEFLKAIPVPNRDFGTYFNLTPGVNADSAHGSNEMSNAYLLDGVNMGDPSTGLDYVGFGADIMEEVAVQTGGVSAEYGSMQGAVVNIVTKSGGNKFSGTASFYYNHESLQSDNVKGTDLYDPDDIVKTGQKFKMEPAFSLGGPIIKNKLWFFFNVNMISEETYSPNYPYDQDEDIAADTKQFLPYAKLTFQPNQDNKFTLSYNFSNRQQNHRGASSYDTVDTTLTQNSPVHTYNAHWTKNFGSNLYANLKVAYIDHLMELHAKQPGTQYSNYSTSRNSGSAWRNEDNNDRDRYQANLDVTTFIDDLLGSHELKIGGEFQMAKVNWNVKTYDGPDIDSIGGYVQMAPAYFGEPGYYRAIDFNGGFDRREEMMNFSFFLNDTWSITNNITLNIGVRYDNQRLIWPVQALDKTSVFNPFGDPIDQSMPEKQTPMKWSNFTPRLGLVYDIFSDGSTMLKMSYSKYVQPNQTGWINTAHPNGWFAYWKYLDHDTGEFNGRYVPLWSPGSNVGVGYGDYDLSAPVTDEVTIGIERELWEDWSVGLRYIRKWDKNNIHSVDASKLDMDALMDRGELVWLNWEAVNYVDPYDNTTLTYYNDLNSDVAQEEYIVNPPGAERSYNGAELTINKRYSKGWAMNFSYVYAKSEGLLDTDRGSQSLGTSTFYHSPNYHFNREGRFPGERRHQIKITGLVKGPLGINFSGYFRYISGARWTRTASTQYIGEELNQGDVSIYAEKRGSRGFPNLTKLDLRVEKAFKISNLRFSVFADIFNVFNANTATGYYTTDASNDTYEFMQLRSIVAPRVIRVGAKIEFN